MEEDISHAPVTVMKRSVMTVSPPDNCDIEILENGRTIRDVIDSKIKEFDIGGNDEPFYVLNLDSVYQRHLRWISNLPRVKPFYAVKCNNTEAVLRVLIAQDIGFDCASKAEIQLALSLGATPDKIIYAHTTKPMSHIRYACTHGIDMMTFDGEDELLKMSLCHPKAKLVLRIAVDDSESLIRLSLKFGARMVSVGKLLERAVELGLNVIGVSFHVGSGCNGRLAFKKAIADARKVFDIGSSLGLQLSLLDIGGGFSGRDHFQVKFEEMSEDINGALEEFFPPDSGVQIIAEPGRFFVESSFTLATKIIAKRVIMDDMDGHDDGAENTPDRTMMYYINDGVYGSLGCLIHDPAHNMVEPYLNRAVESSEQRYRSVIWGPTCDVSDKVADIWIPELHIGDWLLVDDMGAYSVAFSTDFNGFERAHIFLIVTAETWRTLNLKT